MPTATWRDHPYAGVFPATLCPFRCPYDDGPVAVYAPQHTHPHPNFSPDGHYVVFASDRSGWVQVYECRVPDELRQGDISYDDI